MNFLAAFLLVRFMEEQAFWLLGAILEDILPNKFFSDTLVGSRIEMRVMMITIPILRKTFILLFSLVI